MRRTLCVWMTVCGTASLFAAGSAGAIGHGTPDGSPPAEESVCNDAGLVGAAYGLCVAYCEAQDCDVFPDSPNCDRLFDNYVKITGAECFPCDVVTEPPPTE